ncbi:unnamed protein product [Arabidopsis thaliana]|uniref:(thale cress) hypothetical protein n=1 Tax=Arabidopsis thaliana TaxID=3702 RepID=A0A7G2F2H3_ARATH|nr:unnamed protein product [Arabidopsis thaliana]
MAAYYRWKSFEENEDRPEKPRRYGVTEMRGPHYSVLSQNLLQEIFESMGQFVDGLKFSGGSNSLIPKSFIKQAIEMAHEHGVYVSTGDWAEHMLRSGPSAFKDYVEECKQLGFDTIELNANLLEVPEETLLRYVRLIKNGGLRAKPMFAVKFNKSDIPGRNRAFGSYVVPEPRSSEFVEDIDLLIRKAERCLEAGADTIMIDADDVCKYADSLRADIIAKVIGRLGIEKTMFEASDAKLVEWFIKRYGPNVNLYVDHSQIMDLECLRGRHLAIAFGFVFIMNGKLSSGTTPHEADPPQASNLALSPEAAPPDTAMDDASGINFGPLPPFVPEFPGKVIMHFSMGPVRPLTPDVVQKNGGIGLIYVRNPGDSRVECPVNFPCIYLDMEVGSELYTYIQTRSSMKIKISPYKTIIGESVASKVAKSSARGPSSFSPATLKVLFPSSLIPDH